MLFRNIETWPCNIFPRVPTKKEYRAIASGRNDEHDAGAVHVTMMEQLLEVDSLMDDPEYKLARGINYEKIASDCVGAWFTTANVRKACALVKILKNKPTVWNFLKKVNVEMVRFYIFIALHFC